MQYNTIEAGAYRATMIGHVTATYGVDLGDKQSEICALSAGGEVIEQARVATDRQGFTRYFEGREPSLVVLEVGVHSPWVSRLLEQFGHEVIVANARRVRLISMNMGRSDRVDAELLARLGRADPKLLAPVRHRGETVQSDMAVVRSRAALVRARSKLIVCVRNMAKSQGSRIPGCSSANFYRRALLELPVQSRPSFTPILESIDKLTVEIRACDELMHNLCKIRYPGVWSLVQVPGVGMVTALTFILLLEDPHRFRNGRAVGAYLGLAPQRRQSRGSARKLRITKRGDSAMRALLVQCTQFILGPYGEDSALRRKGLRMAAAGGKGARKRAVMAVARALASVLHRLWATGEPYRPFPEGTPDNGGPA